MHLFLLRHKLRHYATRPSPLRLRVRLAVARDGWQKLSHATANDGARKDLSAHLAVGEHARVGLNDAFHVYHFLRVLPA